MALEESIYMMFSTQRLCVDVLDGGDAFVLFELLYGNEEQTPTRQANTHAHRIGNRQMVVLPL